VRDLEELLPWQHMDAGIDTAFFKEQWHASFQGDIKDDCRYGICHACGVCNFDEIQPKVYENCALSYPVQKSAEDHDHFKWLSLQYTKIGDARFFGHLELSNIFSRALRRAGIQVQYSQGFHPMPKLSFDDPLPLGIESQAEEMRVSVSARHGCQQILQQLNRQLPSGVRITKCQLRSSAKKEKASAIQRFYIELTNEEFDPDILNAFNRCHKWPYVKINHKGRERQFDLKEAIIKIESKGKTIILYEIAPNNLNSVRPSDVVVGIFKMPAALLKGAKVMKLEPIDQKCVVDNGSSKS
jgi:radical SAM-linked protein